MDCRYLCWAGYDFLGPGSSTVIVGPPEMAGEQGFDDGSGPCTTKIKIKDVRPSMHGRTSIQSSDRIIHDSLRPFPGPSSP